MANNDIVFNAALTGYVQAQISRAFASPTADDYADVVGQAVLLATAVDALIDPSTVLAEAPTSFTIQATQLATTQAITAATTAVVQGTSIVGATASDYADIALVIVSLANEAISSTIV